MRKNSLPASYLILVLLLMAAFSGCLGGRRIISDKGLKFAKLGEDMPPSGARKFKGMVMRDSLATQGEFEWRIARLKVKGGHIFLEEDFFLQQSINRIRIESDAYRLANGLRVGMTVEDLRQSASPWYVSPLQEFGLFDFYTPLMPGVHFLVKDPSHSMEDEAWEKYLPEDFDGAARIVSLVVY